MRYRDRPRVYMNINDYTYPLPQEKIALYPLEQRDQSKLLIYKEGVIRHEKFSTIADALPSNSLLFFNNTKVVPARLKFQKDTGAEIEIFLLHPVKPSSRMIDAMQAKKNAVWKCTIGNLKRWSGVGPLQKKVGHSNLTALLLSKEEGLVEFNWDTEDYFADIISAAGETPLPPYLRRNAEASDRERYQTIYSQIDGAVAAPTAGLHFTERIFQSLKSKGIRTDFVTLHVSAGTFQPVKVANPIDHLMHEEQIIVRRDTLVSLIHEDRFVVPVGTTSMRTLESLYWYGVKLMENQQAPFDISQHDPYTDRHSLPEKKLAFQAVLSRLDEMREDLLQGKSSIYIYPGYTFKCCQALITNFHQPGSTLILLVAAFVGDDWRKIYNEALSHNYRFLSYGDSSLLFLTEH